MNPIIIHIQNQIAICEASGQWVMALFWRRELVKLLSIADPGIDQAASMVMEYDQNRSEA